MLVIFRKAESLIHNNVCGLLPSIWHCEELWGF